MMNTSSSNRGQVKLKIPPAYIPDPWICNHQRKRSELVSESLALSEQHRKEIQESLKRRNRRSLKPFLTGIVRPKPFIQASSNNKSDKIPAVCKPDNNEPVKTRKIGLNNCSSPKKPNFKSIKSGVSKALVKLKPLYLNKPHGIAKPGLNIKKKLTSIKPKSLSRNSSIKKSPKKVANSSILSKSSKSKANEKASLLEDPFQTADWNFSDWYYFKSTSFISLLTCFYFVAYNQIHSLTSQNSLQETSSQHESHSSLNQKVKIIWLKRKRCWLKRHSAIPPSSAL